MAFQHIRHQRDGFFERLQCFIRLPGQPNFHEYGRGAIDLADVQKGDVILDVALLLKAANAPMTGGCGQTDLFREIGVGDPTLFLQHIEDANINRICAVHGGMPWKNRWFAKEYALKSVLQGLFGAGFEATELSRLRDTPSLQRFLPLCLEQIKRIDAIMIKALTFVLAGMLAQGAAAQVLTSSADTPYVAELIGAGPQPDGSQLAGIRITLSPGWKTYWRSPGAGGIAPRFDWTGSHNLKSVAFIWPAPKLFETYGSVSIGYADELVLPVVMQPHDPNQPIEAELNMAFGVCADICIPAEARLDGQLFEADPRHALSIAASAAQRARTAAEAGLEQATCSIEHKEGDDFVLSAELRFAASLDGDHLLVIETGNDDVWVSESDTMVRGAHVSGQADMINFAEGPLAVGREDLRLTLIGGGGAVDIRGCAG